MRSLAVLLVTAAAAWGIWTFFDGSGTPPTSPELETPAPRPPVDPKANDHAARRARLTTGTLVVTVKDAKGRVPPGARAGYRFAGEDRLREVNAKGEARFTDAPLGMLTVVAKAPGYEEGEQRWSVLAGIRADVYFVLRPDNP